MAPMVVTATCGDKAKCALGNYICMQQFFFRKLDVHHGRRRLAPITIGSPGVINVRFAATEPSCEILNLD
ncbi:MAG: hypothetical protein ABWY27_18115 [Telluria sp.]